MAGTSLKPHAKGCAPASLARSVLKPSTLPDYDTTSLHNQRAQRGGRNELPPSLQTSPKRFSNLSENLLIFGLYIT